MKHKQINTKNKILNTLIGYSWTQKVPNYVKVKLMDIEGTMRHNAVRVFMYGA